MKAKHILISSLIAVTFFTATSCATSVSITNNNEMRAKYIEVDSVITRDQYKILQKVSGSSEYVTIEKGKITGDTFKYGSIKQLTELSSKRNKKDINEALEIARQNALYEVIRKTNELGGDTIIEPLEQIETKIETKGKNQKYYYKVTVTALAVQLTRD